MTIPYAPAFESFVTPARQHPQIWRLILGLIFCTGMVLLGSIFVMWGIALLLGESRSWVFEVIRAESITSIHVILFSFLAMAAGPMLAVRLLHKRSVPSLFGRAEWVIHDFACAMLLCLPVLGLNMFFWSFFYDAVPNLTLTIWLAALPIGLIGLLIQTGAEELLFRGYIQQQLAARFRSPVVWAVVPSVVFGLVHFDETLPVHMIIGVITATTLFGIAAADLTARTGSIGAAWGFHFVNNFAAILLISLHGHMDAASLYLTPYTNASPNLVPLIVLDMITTGLIWLVLRRMLAR